MKANAWRVPQSDFKYRGDVTDASISKLIAGYGQRQTINLSCCDEVTDASISALSAGCGQLRSIDLTY